MKRSSSISSSKYSSGTFKSLSKVKKVKVPQLEYEDRRLNCIEPGFIFNYNEDTVRIMKEYIDNQD